MELLIVMYGRSILKFGSAPQGCFAIDVISHPYLDESGSAEEDSAS